MEARLRRRLSLTILRIACGVSSIVRWQIHLLLQIKGRNMQKPSHLPKCQVLMIIFIKLLVRRFMPSKRQQRLVIALLLCVLVTLLFMNMLIAKDQAPIAIMKALGFTNVDIAIQYLCTFDFCITACYLDGDVARKHVR